MFLDKDSFSSIVKNTPLISIDLITCNQEGKILLGKRVNEPAKGFWFVPGGRIFKDETLDEAFTRTVKDELGLSLKKEESSFYGLYEHFYDNNVFDSEHSTHYIVLAHKITVDEELKLNNQHESYRWFVKDELLQSDDVHQYTKDYFTGDSK